MSITYLPPDTLKKKVFELVAECRTRLAEGHVDMGQVEISVRAYCESIASLPIEDGSRHRQSLHELMEHITLLGEELKNARDNVVKEMGSLENIRKASKAYYSARLTSETVSDNQNE